MKVKILRAIHYAVLNEISCSLNRYAKRASQSGSINEADILNLKKQQDDIWGQTKEILKKLSSVG